MIASEKLLKNRLDYYNQFLIKNIFEVIIKQIFSSEKMRNSSNCIYDYVHSFFGENF